MEMPMPYLSLRMSKSTTLIQQSSLSGCTIFSLMASCIWLPHFSISLSIIFRCLIYLMPQGHPTDESFMIFYPFLIIISFLFTIQLHFIEILFQFAILFNMNCFISDDTNIMDITMQGSTIIENNIEKVSHPFIWISLSFSVKLNSFLTRLKKFLFQERGEEMHHSRTICKLATVDTLYLHPWELSYFSRATSAGYFNKLLTMCYLS